MAAGPRVRVSERADLESADRVIFVVVAGRPVPRSLVDRIERLFGAGSARALTDPDAPVPPPHQVVRVSATPLELATAGATVGRTAPTSGAAVCVVPAISAPLTRRFTQSLVMGAQRLGVDESVDVTLSLTDSDRTDAAEEGIRTGERILLARRLANTPGNVKDPRWLADQAHAVAGGALHVDTHDTDWLRQRGFGGILAVGSGSASPPNLTRLEYRGSRTGPHIVLVGKGITFDSGGLSLKPAASMPLMKTDMSGAAAVIAAMAALRDAAAPVRVTGLIACAENMPSGSAMRPGDVVRHYGGRTTEVLNTDAEGRLVLADSLAYAADRLRPDLMVDLATLTGAATVGLGRQHAALYSTSDRLARDLVAAGTASGDAVWRMPLVHEYAQSIESGVADAANTNTDGHTQAGSITAALFLMPFAGSVPWAHLDIAGTARTESDLPDCRKGATGFGVSLLTEWIRRRSR